MPEEKKVDVNSLISVVMPTYNAAEMIGAAIESVVKQSYKEWELLVVDDASTDNTEDVVREYTLKYPQVKYYKMPYNTGSARMPRLCGVKFAKGGWISTLDSDDYLEEECLQKLMTRQKETEADIVLGKMVEFEHGTNNVIAVLPKSEFDITRVYSGKEACDETIGRWNISFNPTLIRSNLYKSIDGDNSMMLMDEVDTRKLLLMSDKVAFCNAEYHYRNYLSVSRKVSLKTFDQIELSFFLLDIVGKEYGVGSKSYERQLLYCLHNLRNRLYIYKLNNNFSLEDKIVIERRLMKGYKRIKQEKKILHNLPFYDRFSLISYKMMDILETAHAIKNRNRK